MLRALFSFVSTSIARRLALAFILFALPVCFVTWQLVVRQDAEIDFTRAELSGAVFLDPLLDLHAEMADTAAAIAAGKPVSPDLGKALDAVSQARLRAPANLRFGDDYAALKQAVGELQAMSTYDPARIRDALGASQRHFTRVVEGSNLILDTELRTFYFIQTVGLNATPLIEQISYFGSAKAFSDRPSPRPDRSFALLVAKHQGYLDARTKLIEASMDDAIRVSTNARKSQLELAARRADMAAKLDLLVNDPETSRAHDHAQAARDAVLSTVKLANQEMIHGLEVRIARLRTDQDRVLGTAFGMFLIALLGVLMFVRDGVVHPLGQLTKAMRQVAEADFTIDPPYQGRADEIGGMARALSVFKENALARVRAEHAAKAKSDFLAMMSHEIRTPMNGVIGMAQALTTTELKDDQRRMLSVMIDSGEILLMLLNDILDMAKIEAGKIELEAIPFSPQKLVSSARDLFESQATAKNIQLTVNIDPLAVDWRVGDLGRLRQVLFNLVSNAIKFTEQGQVAISIRQGPRQELIMEVADTGIGIPEDRLALLFEKFTQADSSHTRLYGGTGLGLSIARAMVEAMDGRLEVESKVNVGSVFTCILPLKVIPSPAEDIPLLGDAGSLALAEAKDDPETRTKAMRILVAEDNQTNQTVLQALLGSFDIDLHFVLNGKEAVEAWQNGPYEVILMDMQMPVMDGASAIRAIRGQEMVEGRMRIPIVALTANALQYQVDSQLEAGADAHAPKPIHLPTLLAAIESAISLCELQNGGGYAPCGPAKAA